MIVTKKLFKVVCGCKMAKIKKRKAWARYSFDFNIAIYSIFQSNQTPFLISIFLFKSYFLEEHLLVFILFKVALAMTNLLISS